MAWRMTPGGTPPVQSCTRRARPAGIASFRRRLRLDLVEEREVPARHVLDLIAEGAGVVERTGRWLEPVPFFRHRLGKTHQRVLDHREPLRDRGGHRIDRLLRVDATSPASTRHECDQRQESSQVCPCHVSPPCHARLRVGRATADPPDRRGSTGVCAWTKSGLWYYRRCPKNRAVEAQRTLRIADRERHEGEAEGPDR